MTYRLRFGVLLAFGACFLCPCRPPVLPEGDIHGLIESGKVAEARTLLRRNPRLAHRLDRDNHTPLHIAVERGDLDMVRLLLTMKVNVNQLSTSIKIPWFWPTTPLDIAVYKEFGEIATVLRQAGAVHSVGDAVYMNDMESLHAALEYQRRHGQKDSFRAVQDWKLLFHMAIARGNAPMIKLLLENGADPNTRYPFTLHIAFGAMEHPQIMKQLLHAGADPNAYAGHPGQGRVPIGERLLHWATTYGYREVVEMLIEKGANINFKDDEGDTALDYALRRDDRKEIADLLRQRGGKHGKDLP
jgi:ankyrin repeat protein